MLGRIGGLLDARSHLFVLLLLLSSCGTEESVREAAGCVLTSDCFSGQVCEEGICVEEDPCQSRRLSGCPCESDSDCIDSEICSVEEAICIEPVCTADSECPLGSICGGSACLIDVFADRDRDGVPDGTEETPVDNCPDDINPSQVNHDRENERRPGFPAGDRYGDVCDDDDDNDGVDDAVDNCELTYNPEQRDADDNGIGDRCDETLLNECGGCLIYEVSEEALYCDASCRSEEVSAGSACAPCPVDQVRKFGDSTVIICDCREGDESMGLCGNGVVEAGEQCDDDNRETERCGAGDESCVVCGALCTEVPGAEPDNPCEVGCVPRLSGDEIFCECLALSVIACGNGIQEEGEGCDDGNTTTERCAYGEEHCEVCSDACQLVAGETSFCGDGVVSDDEGCDDGNPTTERCAYGEEHCEVCSDACQLVAGETSFCGDGVVNGDERCDGDAGCDERCEPAAPEDPELIIERLPCAEEIADCPNLEWVFVQGGVFMMGSPEGEGRDNQRPQREVTVPDFYMMRSEVTVAQYRACVDAGACEVPRCDVDSDYHRWRSCNYAHGREDHPVNFVNWRQLRRFAGWVTRADLPTESQWEFAARSRGQDITYPWGDEAPDCTRADWDDTESLGQSPEGGCEGRGTSPICSFPAGNSAEGICDLIGNLSEWILDESRNSYADAPTDGSARCRDEMCTSEQVNLRVVRGASWRDSTFSTRNRGGFGPDGRTLTIGGRLARPAP